MTGRIARVDYDQCARVEVVASRVAQCAIQLVDRHRPAFALVEIVRQQRAAEQRDARRVERVLRYRTENAVVAVAYQHRQHRLDGGTRAVGEKNVIGIRRKAVALRNEARHVLAHKLEALAVRVRAGRRADAGNHSLGARDGVRMERLERVRIIQQTRTLDQTQNLAQTQRRQQKNTSCIEETRREQKKCKFDVGSTTNGRRARKKSLQKRYLSIKRDRRLIELLRIADVAIDDLVERQLVLARLELGGQLIGPRNDGAANSILHLASERIHVLLGEQRTTKNVAADDRRQSADIVVVVDGDP